MMRELESGENKVTINSIRKDSESAETAAESPEQIASLDDTVSEPDKFRHYSPSVVDFLRRCDTEVQAEEIIAYLQKRGELTEGESSHLKVQLKKHGVRSFGPKKEDDYYFRQSGFC